MRRLLALATLLLGFSACRPEELPRAYRRLEVPEARLVSTEAQQRGRILFLKYCSLCHGEKADGHGPRQNLSSRPQDFTSPDWLRGASPRKIYWVIQEGKAGTAMAAWKVLDADETWDLVAYLMSVAGPPRNSALSDCPPWTSGKRRSPPGQRL